MSEFPLAQATLKALLAERSSASASASSAPASTSFRVGPGVLRAPPASVRRPAEAVVDDAVEGDDEERATEDLLGELLDMVLVGADDADSGLPEVHLQFKADVFGGLHLRLVKKKEGLEAFFVVHDAAARRAVVDHVEELVKHLKQRGFAIVGHSLVVA